MADSNTGEILNRLMARLYRSLLQYAVDCWPWTSASESDADPPEQKAIEQLARAQKEFVARLVDLIVEQAESPDFGNYPDNSELHYVALDYLLGKLVADEQDLIAEFEVARPLLEQDPEAAALVAEILSAEIENLARLRELSKAVPAATVV
jgi:hypothetical protein